jgi:PAS domain S-box-containing protein
MNPRGLVDDQLLRESLQDLYEQAPCGYLFTLPDGLITRVNQTFLTWTGYRREELEATVRFQDLLTVPGRIFYENQYDPLLRLQGFVNEVAFDLQRKGADPMPALVSSVQRQDEEGRHLLTASIVFNATDRRRYEQELLAERRNAERLATVVKLASDAIVSISPEGIVDVWNAGAERHFGYPSALMVGRQIGEVLSLVGEACERVVATLRSGQSVEMEAAVRHADGRLVEVSAAFTPHRGLLGELSAVSAIMRDITERKTLERLQHELTVMVVHDLRSPLAGIKLTAQLLTRLGTYNAELVNRLDAQADRLKRQIDDLLDASRIETGRLSLERARLDLRGEVTAAVEQFQAQNPRQRFHLEAPSEPLSGDWDAVRIGEVLANLLSNAVKYGPEDGEIAVTVERLGPDAQVSVQDQGPGIAPEEQQRVFERFYRADRARAAAQSLGLGLYISKGIVEAHGGRIWVDSEGEGKGSTFSFRLPLARSHESVG